MDPRLRPPRFSWLIIIAVFAVLVPISPSELSAQASTISGQLRTRFEYRDPVGAGLDDFTSMRVRIAFERRLDERLTFFAQMQDVRIWGEETSPLFDFRADQLDLHQGFIRYRGERLDWLTATVGRMEASLGGQRLLGAVDWAQQGQSFDGVRLDAVAGRTTWTLLGYVLSDETAASNDFDAELVGVYGTVADLGSGTLDLYWLHHRVNDVVESREHAIGARWVHEGAVDARVEGTVERGQRAGVDVSAFMTGVRVGRSFADGRAGVTLWYDYLSGDDPATPEVEVFNTFFGTNHKFYGHADLFLNIPAQTGGAGLQDLAIKTTWSPVSGVHAAVDLHSFRVAEQGALGGAHLADEIDVALTHRYSSALAATVGLSHVRQGAALGEIGRLTSDMTWFFVMLDAHF